ncbi:MAG: DUF2752 domain-containing protein [Mucilaginibacter polytrichastri]|nr:DUF2752 domain-containing protein [Mucilaginibacter polytrichastri]
MVYSELIFLVGGLTFLAFLDPEKSHFSLCPFHHLGILCPGCGLGRSISWIFRGEIGTSFRTHFFGLPALAILLSRIVQLTRHLFSPVKIQHGRTVPA